MLSTAEIKKIVRKSTPLSPSAAQILRISGDQRHELRELVRIVECDTVLTAGILRVANSAAFRPKEPVTSLSMAIPFLGERVVVSVALDICAHGLYQAPLKGYESDKGDLWKHSLQTALAAREACRFARKPIDGGLAFTAGILHDIGKTVLSPLLSGAPSEFGKASAKGELLSYLEEERARLGTDHCEAGAVLAEHWKLPEFFRSAIKHHHEPSNAPPENAPLTFAVHVGDLAAMMNGYGTGADSMHYRMDQACDEYFSLDAERMSMLILAVNSEFEKIQDSLGS